MCECEKKYLTAQEAHAIATNWQDNKINGYVENALREIRAAADKGKFHETIHRPNDGVDSDGCYNALESLGYRIDRGYAVNYIAVSW